MDSVVGPERFTAAVIACSCGRTHENPTRTIVYDEGVTGRLGDVLSGLTPGRKLHLFADVRTFTAGGQAAQDALQAKGWSVTTVIVPDTPHGPPVCDDVTFEKYRTQVRDADIMLAVGSGVINDLTKWIAFDLGKPYAVLATAASMNGYTAANVAPTLRGVKSIVYARAPVAVLAVPSIIRGAPFEMTASGLGDVIAKPISTADWVMNHFFFGEYYCPEIAEMITAIEPCYFDHPEAVRDREPKAIEGLYQGLIYSGLAMTLVGTSAPASGGEHMLSHTLDMMSSVDGRPHDLHGRQVGLGTILAAALYERLFQIESPRLHRLPAGIDRPFWGSLADAVAEQYALKQPHLTMMAEKLSVRGTWRSFLNAVRPKVRTPQAIKDCLRQAGAAHRVEDLSCSRERVRAAVGHMHEIRKRCTVVDLAWLLGVLPEAANELIDQWLS